MLEIYHPQLGNLKEYAILSVASYHDDFIKSPFYRLFNDALYQVYPQQGLNHNGFTCNDQQRKEAIEDCFAESRFVVASRGGYGSIRSLEKVAVNKDWEGVLCGFSDLTVLINYLAQNTQIACFHGPMLNYPKTWTNSRFLKKSFEKLICSKELKYIDCFEGQFLKGSKLSGILCGGNLSVICSMIGTKFEIDLRDKVLFLEEINEPSYKIDRMLMQLSLQKDFSKLRGIVFGQFTNCEARPVGCGDLEVLPLIQSFTEKWGFPVVWNAPIGHINDFMVLPIGGESSWVLSNGGQIEVTLSYPKNIKKKL